MNFERQGLLLPESSRESIDKDLFASFCDAHAEIEETYKCLSLKKDQKERAKASFANGQNVDLSLDKLSYIQSQNSEFFGPTVDYLTKRQYDLRFFKKDLLDNNDISRDVKQLYRWRINEDIASLGMLIASRAGNMEKFRRWNEYVYGKPNEEIYRAALDWIATDAEKMISDDNQNPVIVEAAKKVLILINDRRGNREILSPDEKVFEMVREDHMNPMGYYGLLLSGIDKPESKKISNDLGDPILNQIVHDNLLSDYEISDASGASWGVSHSTKSVERPSSYNLPIKRFFGLIGHEIGSHLLEKVNGSRGPIQLAESGLDRYELGNEGRAVIREQVQYEKFEDFGKLPRWRELLRRHIAISYACGVGESGPKSSAEVYKFMNTIDTMYQAKQTPDEPDVIKDKATAKTTELLLRVLKGTDGNGGAYLKDKVYLEGVVANWLTASKQGPESISQGDLGKFDINNSRHIIALQKIGLLPNNE
jgi:hypothetical protein